MAPCIIRIRFGRTAIILMIGILLQACVPAAAATPTLPAIAVEQPAATATAIARPATPIFGDFDPARVTSLRLADYPVVPVISAAARATYAAGLARGSNPRVFSKLGDCMTENPYFLVTFSEGRYDLGPYSGLESVIDHYRGVPARTGEWTLDSFATKGLAAASGFNIAGPLDPTWADPKWCRGGESPAACEFRVARSSVALIMFGTNDVAYTDPASYDYFLRGLIEQALADGVLPMLSTFPTRPEEPAKSLLFNQIVARAAVDYDIPLINLNRALEPLPNHGVNPADTIHLSVPADGRADRFTPADLQFGFTVRNLVTLQALQALMAAVNQG